ELLEPVSRLVELRLGGHFPRADKHAEVTGVAGIAIDLSGKVVGNFVRADREIELALVSQINAAGSRADLRQRVFFVILPAGNLKCSVGAMSHPGLLSDVGEESLLPHHHRLLLWSQLRNRNGRCTHRFFLLVRHPPKASVFGGAGVRTSLPRTYRPGCSEQTPPPL